MLSPSLRPKRCKGCREQFQPLRLMQQACTPLCALKVAATKREKAEAREAKAERAETKEKLAKLKTRSSWMKDAQQAVNAFVRQRDAKLPCVSCGRHHQGQYHAGHYLSTGARPELRFDPDNIHKQCQPCNTHLHGNLVLYRAELIRRVGLAKAEWLEGPHAAQKYDVPELRAIRDAYRIALRDLKSGCE